MKTLKKIFLFALLLCGAQLHAQTDKPTTARIVEAQNYVFVARTAIPLNSSDISRVMNSMPGYSGGGNINLNGSGYDLTVTKDSLVAYLPYYGRSYTPKLGNPDDSGIKFKSKDFKYKITPRKKGWLIEINPKDVKDNYSLTLNITQSGYGSLVINSTNQQTITFEGYLAEPKPRKKK